MSDPSDQSKHRSIVDAVSDRPKRDDASVLRAEDLVDDLEEAPESILSGAQSTASSDTKSGRRPSMRTLIQGALGLIAGMHGLMGALFILMPGPIFSWLSLGTMPHHAYTQVIGLLIVIFAVMLGLIALAPKRRRMLLAYPLSAMAGTIAIILGHWLQSGPDAVPLMWKLWVGQEILVLIVVIAITIRLFLPGQVESGE